MRVLIIPLVVLSLMACGRGEQTQTSSKKIEPMSKVARLAELRSGYRGTQESMELFLKCWSREIEGFAGGGGDEVRSSTSGSGAISLDDRLPLSARHFFQVAPRLGFRSLYERQTGYKRFFGRQLKLFKEYAPADYELWKAAYGGLLASDEEYYRYDQTQGKGVRLRAQHLDRMLVVGGEKEGATYLLIPDEVTKDGEFEAQILHHGGLIVRFRSFAHLLSHLYLEEHERIGGKDPSLGHLYYYSGNLAHTCVSHVIDL